jgi:hypothetical protein
MNELQTLLEDLDPISRYQLLARAFTHYLRRRPRLVPIYATLAVTPLFFCH